MELVLESRARTFALCGDRVRSFYHPYSGSPKGLELLVVLGPGLLSLQRRVAILGPRIFLWQYLPSFVLCTSLTAHA